MSEPGPPTAGPTPRVVVVPEPGVEAEAYARRLGADVTTDRGSVETAVEARAAAAAALRDEASGPDDGDAEDLLARATTIRAVAAAAPIADGDLERLHELAAEVARADRIRTHTERRFEELARERVGLGEPIADPASSPTVGAVAAFHRKAQARWRVLWASVGGGEPPEPDQLDIAIDGLDGRRRRAAADLVRLERFERRAAASAVLARPLVVVEPTRWIPADELGRLLGRLAPVAQVIVLERRSTDERRSDWSS